MIRPHCMGTEFPKRDTDASDLRFSMKYPEIRAAQLKAANELGYWPDEFNLPSGADLDAVAEEQRVKEQTS